MKKLLLLSVMVLPLLQISAKKKEAPLTLDSEIDSVSYAFGVNVASGLSKQMEQLPGASDFNMDMFLKAFSSAIKNEDVLIKNEETGNILERYFIKAEEAKFRENKEAGEKFLENNSKCADVVTLPSGLQYQVITMGTGEKPTLTDKVTVNYKGTFIDGKEFDSSYKRNAPATFGLTQVIKGWTEALQLMPVGSKWRLFIPQELGYGDRQVPGIQPYSVLIFDVELLDIVK